MNATPDTLLTIIAIEFAAIEKLVVVVTVVAAEHTEFHTGLYLDHVKLHM